MCGFIRVFGAGRVGGIPDGDKASFQHHRMLLLALFLKLDWVKLKWVQGLSDFLVANLGFFFVPSGVALMLYFDIIEAQFWPIVIASVVSTLLVFLVTGWIHQIIRRSNGISRK